MSGDRPLSVLLLADDQKGHPNTIHDHIQAFRRYSRHDVFLLNPRGLARSRFLVDDPDHRDPRAGSRPAFSDSGQGDSRSSIVGHDQACRPRFYAIPR